MISSRNPFVAISSNCTVYTCMHLFFNQKVPRIGELLCSVWYGLIESFPKSQFILITLNSKSKRTLFYLTSTQKQWSLEIQGLLHHRSHQVLLKYFISSYSRSNLIYYKLLFEYELTRDFKSTWWDWWCTLWILVKSKSVYFLLELSVLCPTSAVEVRELVACVPLCVYQILWIL